ncbi:MAG: formate--phosphoribosylaminoimidazolecarboxamide ligase family protein [Methanophagales archaeon]|nr:formate--phosphoribosylaminoimidazolecarboxamide ligase family protein [Methanophagales archaeon]MCW3139600.1 formate--phosphoribosylaminoimidazolecarboxamide ligase family protein [Methanophagales archaeon]MCW7070338.1 formate--phosphoribosylaminoimidazolecarboxamide ligase family protein [Methanophagales archaeon]
MIARSEIEEVLVDYDLDKVIVGVLGSHSALDVCDGAKEEGFKTLVIAEKGREELYTKYFIRKEINGLQKGVVDENLVVSRFADMMSDTIQDELRSRNTLFIPNRSFVVYTGIDNVEDRFKVPLVGSRDMLRIEEREEEKSYYWLCEQAGIPTPEEYKAEDIDTLVMVKLPHAKMRLERGFFTAKDRAEYREKSQRLIQKGIITADDLANARIERYVIGPVFNFDFFYSPIDDELELLGVDWRFESNLDGMARIPRTQELPEKLRDPLMIVVGHASATLRESLLNRVMPIAERFVKFAKEEYSAGIIGPFCLQTIVDENMDFWVYDIATRIGGGTNIHMYSGHPYGNALFRTNMSSGRRLALEIRRAIALDKVDKIVT